MTSPEKSIEKKPAPPKTLNRFLGVFSAALGVPQTFMTERFLRFIGLRPTDEARKWTRVVGVREHLPAVGLLSGWRPALWLWSRVAGDVMDLALLGAARRQKKADQGRLNGATAGVVGALGIDLLAAVANSRASQEDATDDTRQVKSAVTVWRPREEVYAFWHDFRNLPRFMAHLESVEPSGNGHSNWKAKRPIGGTVDWDAELLEDRPNEAISWRSLPGASVENSGTVRFKTAPDGSGTEIHLDMTYKPPGGAVGLTLAKIFGEEPKQQVEDDLRRFKQVIEAGEVVRSDGSPEGALARRQMMQRPAHPSKKAASASTDGGAS